MRAAVVVPTNRPERIRAFCEFWEPQFHRDDVRLIVVEDAPTATEGLAPNWAEHFTWEHIDCCGVAPGCFPRRTGAVRDYGFWLAGQDESVDIVVSLDDDVLPLTSDLIGAHWAMLEAHHPARWQETAPFATRGLPYAVRDGVQTVMNHGLWSGMPDLAAFSQLQQPDANWEPNLGDMPSLPVAPGCYFTCCSMNLAIRREYVRYFWMPVLPDGYKRWDDIWAGIVFKRLADLYGWGVTTGRPIVRHERASNVVANLRQEMLGYGINERLWEVVDKVPECGSPRQTFVGIWHAIAREFPQLGDVWDKTRQWTALWEAG